MVPVILNCQKNYTVQKEVGLIVKIFNGNECFKWCLVRYLHPADHHPARIRRVDEGSARELHFKDIKFPVNPLHDGEERGEGGGGGVNRAPTIRSPIPSANVRISRQNFMTFTFNFFATLV